MTTVGGLMPEAARLGPAVIVQGRALLQLERLARVGLEVVQRADGIRPSPATVALMRLLDEAAAEARAALVADAADLPDVRNRGSSARSSQTFIGSQEAAQMLGVTERQVRRLAAHLGGRKRGRSWSFDRVEVAAHAAETGRVVA